MSAPLGTPDRPALVEWGVAARVRAGETESGDRHVVRAFPGGILVAAVDGLGHGPQAAKAARLAAAALEEHAQEALAALVQRCHAALAGSRGAVMSLASFDGKAGAMSWLGVGNVEGVLVRAGGGGQHQLLLRGGVVGYQLPSLQAAVLPVGPGDVLALATDGVRSGFAVHLGTADSPQRLAERVLSEHARDTDDAVVVVARFRGRER